MRATNAREHRRVRLRFGGVQQHVVLVRVAGDFPGSPVELQHAFRLDGGRIASLEIR